MPAERPGDEAAIYKDAIDKGSTDESDFDAGNIDLGNIDLPVFGALIKAARAARSNAYAPYSAYAVGAAVVTDDGRFFSGANVENASYGATVCAERVAIWTAIAAGARRISAMAVVTPNGGAPCGICRQVLHEFADGSVPVALVEVESSAANANFRVILLRDLLPLAWGADDLGVGGTESSRGDHSDPE